MHTYAIKLTKSKSRLVYGSKGAESIECETHHNVVKISLELSDCKKL